MKGRGCILVDNLFITSLILDHLANKKFNRNGTRTVSDSFGQFCLQTLGKGVIAFTGNDSEDIDVMHIVAKDIGIHSLAVLVDA